MTKEIKHETWSLTEDIDSSTIAVSGEIDYSTSPTLRTHLHDFISKSSGEVKADLSGLEYLDSSGLAVLIEARRILQEKGRAMRITDITGEVRKIFELTQVGQLFGL